MKKDVINVKEQSVVQFLNSNIPQAEKVIIILDEYQNHCRDEKQVSVYHLMKDDMHFDKDCGIKVGQKVTIELTDYARRSEKKLRNTYTYEAQEYDDVTIKMKLVDFKVEFADTDTNE